MSCWNEIHRAARLHLTIYEYVLPLALSLPIPSFFYPGNDWLRLLAITPSVILMGLHVSYAFGLASDYGNEVTGPLSELLAAREALSRQRRNVAIFYHAGLLPALYALSNIHAPWYTLLALAANTLTLFFYKLSWTSLLEVARNGTHNTWL